MELYKLNSIQLKELLDKKEISAVDLIKNLLEWIEKVEDKIHAFITLDKENIINQAKESDKRRKNGKQGLLEGIPIAIKDNICVKDLRTTAGSKILENFVSLYSAHVVEKIKKEGGIILGKTNMDEFAMGSSCENSAFFKTYNPWDIKKVPGGSSGGSAAAVAGYMTPLALGTDTGGSIRQPSAFCGIVGLKPTYGRVSRYGLIAFASTLDQIGPMGRSVEDIALLLKVIAGEDKKDSTTYPIEVKDYLDYLNKDLKIKKIGIVKKYFDQLSPEIRKLYDNVLKLIEKKLEVELIEIDLKYTDYALPTYYLIATSEASANLARYDGIHYGYRANEDKIKEELENSNFNILEKLYMKSRAQGFGKEVKRRILLGTYALSSGYYSAYYIKALKLRQLIKQDVEESLKKVDVLISPTSPITAFDSGEKVEKPLEMYLCDIFTVTFSLSGNPAISIPCGLNKENLPFGLQIVGKKFKEETIINIAYKIQNILNFQYLDPQTILNF